MTFHVIDTKTNEKADCQEIIRTEPWARHLCKYDIDSFAVLEDGTIILIDDCDNIAYPPKGRFVVVIDEEEQRQG